MKTNILSLMLCFCMGLLPISCSDDEKNTSEESDVNKVQLIATYPEMYINARAQAPSGHKLRCILEIWSKGEGAKLVYHEEVAADPATSMGKLFFNFQMEAGTYDCIMWTDYIDISATAASTRYPDKYYDTSDLKEITVKNVNEFMNNEACNAFFYTGEIQKESGEILQMELPLIHVLTKISIQENNPNEFSFLKGVAVSYSTFMKFNVYTGMVFEERVTVNYNEDNYDPAGSENGTLFTIYVLADKEKRSLGEMNMDLTTSSKVQHVVVPDIIPLLRGQHIKVSGSIMEAQERETEFEISFDIDVMDWNTSDVNITHKN